MEHLMRLLYTPTNEFTPLDMLGIVALVLIVIGSVMTVFTAGDILIKQWRGERDA